MAFLMIMTLNALSFSGLLFLLSAGFSLIFGLMRIPNMAHGAYFLLGGYVGSHAIGMGIPFILAMLIAGITVAGVGYVTERYLLRRLFGNELAQVLATLGLSLVVTTVCLMVWGGMPIQAASPSFATGALRFGSLVFPAYRLFIVGAAGTVGVLLWYFIDRTRLGATIRAGVDDSAMAQAVGIRVSALFTTVFCIGAALAGMAGTLAAPLLSVYPGLDVQMLGLAMIVVVVGGVGSLLGSVIGSLTIGFVYTFGQALFTEFAFAMLFFVMIVVLAVRPQGLCGRTA